MRFVHRSFLSYRFTVALVAMACMSHASYAVDVDSSALQIEQMNHEVKRLRRDLATMQKEFYKDQTSREFVKSNLPRGDISSQVELQLSENEEQLRQMNGKVEKVDFRLNAIEKKLDKTLQNISERLTQLEQSAAPASGSDMVRNFGDKPVAKPAAGDVGTSDKDLKATADTPEEKAAPADETAFKEAKTLLEQAQYEAASIKLQAFINTYKESSYLPEAYFWQGELSNIREEYENAAISFLKAYQTEPTGDKAGESLLQLGSALGNLDKKKEACTTFTKASKEFPKDGELKKKLDNERQRLGC